MDQWISVCYAQFSWSEKKLNDLNTNNVSFFSLFSWLDGCIEMGPAPLWAAR